jgi:hypothetical protein
MKLKLCAPADMIDVVGAIGLFARCCNRGCGVSVDVDLCCGCGFVLWMWTMGVSVALDVLFCLCGYSVGAFGTVQAMQLTARPEIVVATKRIRLFDGL